MASSTPYFGWPITDASTLIEDYANTMASGLKAVENQFIVPIDAHNNAAASTSYPLGMSLMTLSSTGASSGNWPVAGSAQVLTLRRTNAEAATQFFIATNPTAPIVYVRTAATGSWSPWTLMAGSGQPWAVKSDTHTWAATNLGQSITISFPSGLFTARPQITTSVYDPQMKVTVSGVSKSGFTLTLCANDGTSTMPATKDWTADWTAIQTY